MWADTVDQRTQPKQSFLSGARGDWSWRLVVTKIPSLVVTNMKLVVTKVKLVVTNVKLVVTSNA